MASTHLSVVAVPRRCARVVSWSRHRQPADMRHMHARPTGGEGEGELCLCTRCSLHVADILVLEWHLQSVLGSARMKCVQGQVSPVNVRGTRHACRTVPYGMFTIKCHVPSICTSVVDMGLLPRTLRQRFGWSRKLLELGSQADLGLGSLLFGDKHPKTLQ